MFACMDVGQGVKGQSLKIVCRGSCCALQRYSNGWFIVFLEVTVMKAALRRFIKDERGLETVEYAIILGIIVAGTIGAVVTLGGWVATQFTATNTLIGTNGQ